MYKILIAVLVLLVIPTNPVSANSEIEYFYTSGQAKITTSDLIVKVTSAGNIPQFFFWAKGEEVTTETLNPTETHVATPTEAYQDALLALNQDTQESENTEADNGDNDGRGKEKPHLVKFLEMFEFEDRNGNGVFDQGDARDAQSKVTFPASTWSFSDFAVDMTDNSVSAVHFNFTHDSSPTIAFHNHVYAKSSNTLKFDIEIDDYSWHNSPTDNTKLAIKILFTGSGNVQAKEQNHYTVGQGFFTYKESAQGAAGSVNVTSATEGNNAIYLCYDYFGASLFHDPEIGVSTSTDDAGIEFLFVISGVLLVASLVVRMRRKNLMKPSNP